MVIYRRRSRLNISTSKIAFVALFILLLFYIFNYLYKKQIEQKKSLISKTQEESWGFPVRLVIPAINVNANITRVGISSNGDMEVPSNIMDVGWFELGPRPGEKGSAVMAGHLNGKNGEAGVFAELYKLRKGDKLYVEYDKGPSTTFIVQEARAYDPGYADEVFTQSDNSYLNLITCDGIWSKSKKSYNKRLVVFAGITN